MPVRPDEGLSSFRDIFIRTRLCSKCGKDVQSPRGCISDIMRFLIYVSLTTQQVIYSSSLLPPTLALLLYAPCKQRAPVLLSRNVVHMEPIARSSNFKVSATTSNANDVASRWEKMVVHALTTLTELFPVPYTNNSQVYDILPHVSIGHLLSLSQLPDIAEGNLQCNVIAAAANDRK